MASATKIELAAFDENLAINGATIAFSTTGTLSGEVKEYVQDFKIVSSNSSVRKYSGQVQKKLYYFNSQGKCYDEDSMHNLFIVQAEIEDTKGTTATRAPGGSSENIGIDILQPREYFAISALQGILSKIDNPLLLDDGQITLISSMAFKIAQSMMDTAADCRATTQTSTPPSIDVDINNVTSTTDKILYNLNENIKSINDNIKNISNEDRVQKVAISSVPSDGVPVNVTNSTLTTHVDNMPTVPSEPISVTGTVNVGNFPSTKT